MSQKEKYSTQEMEQHLKDMQDLNEAASALFRIPAPKPFYSKSYTPEIYCSHV